MLALVFIRKLLDLCFTNRELSWLDDLMPESKKKKEDDKKKKAKEVRVQLFSQTTAESCDSPTDTFPLFPWLQEAQRMLEVEEGIAHPYDGPGILKTLKVRLVVGDNFDAVYQCPLYLEEVTAHSP